MVIYDPNILEKNNLNISSFFERTHSGLPTTCQNDHFLIEENTMEKHYAVFSLLIVAGGYFFSAQRIFYAQNKDYCIYIPL